MFHFYYHGFRPTLPLYTIENIQHFCFTPVWILNILQFVSVKFQSYTITFWPDLSNKTWWKNNYIWLIPNKYKNNVCFISWIDNMRRASNFECWTFIFMSSIFFSHVSDYFAWSFFQMDFDIPNSTFDNIHFVKVYVF